VRDGISAARYLASGHLVYAQGTALFAIPFDPQARAGRGGSVPMVDAVRRSSNGFSDTAFFDVSETGTLVTVPGIPNGGSGDRIERTLAWVDRDGREDPLPVRPDEYTMARISPDGTKVALVLGSPILGGTRPAIWLFDQRTENLSLLTADPTGGDGPVWSADGRRIFFRSLRGDTPGVYAIEVDTGETKLLASFSPEFPNIMPWTISPDDRTLGLITTQDITTLSLADGELAWLLHNPEIIEHQPSFSPNGEWIAYYEASGPGTAEINIRPFPAVSRTRIPVGRGLQPVFSRDGSNLFFLDAAMTETQRDKGDGLAAVPITYEPTPRVGTRQRLFATAGYFLSAPGRAWDVDPNGQRFLMIREPATNDDEGELPAARIDVVLNWFEELNRLAPTE
jgi:hypothetical protein